jgi:protein associated with RNAse G/E
MPELITEELPPKQTVTVRAYKYDGREHRHWRAQILKQEDQLLILDAKFSEEINHPLLGIIELGTVSIEYYWLDRWYNIFRFLKPDGELRNFYCNVNVPPCFSKGTLSYIDLDIDVLVEADLSFTVLDEDEFAANALSFNYPNDIQQHAYRALEELIQMIRLRSYPFT